jgi:hypothetical protein
MPNYNWTEFRTASLKSRYPGWVAGKAIFEGTAAPSNDTVRLLEEQRKRGPLPQVRRLFVSHRQVDYNQALRLAYLACNEGFDYWLDILDPSLTATTSGEAKAAAVATIIEMALLNCTHIIAVMTPNTRGSEWVPYEYGRAKEAPPISSNAACWVAPQVQSSLPDYLHLGPVHKTESDIRNWLRAQRSPQLIQAQCSWSSAIPAPLP